MRLNVKIILELQKPIGLENLGNTCFMVCIQIIITIFL